MDNFFPLPEQQAAISFHFEDVDPNWSTQLEKGVSKWLPSLIRLHHGQLGVLNFIFCSDSYLYQLNLQYLQHDTLTDIITFPYSAFPEVSGDIFISLDRVQENAGQRNLSFHHELFRVIAHGVLHLCGFGDKTPGESAKMRTLEDQAMELPESPLHNDI